MSKIRNWMLLVSNWARRPDPPARTEDSVHATFKRRGTWWTTNATLSYLNNATWITTSSLSKNRGITKYAVFLYTTKTYSSVNIFLFTKQISSLCVKEFFWWQGDKLPGRLVYFFFLFLVVYLWVDIECSWTNLADVSSTTGRQETLCIPVTQRPVGAATWAFSASDCLIPDEALYTFPAVKRALVQRKYTKTGKYIAIYS
jgi:hypothetical protein